MRAIIPFLMVAPAHAAIVGVVPMNDARLLLHDTKGVCVGEARYAEHVDKHGEKIGGCWVTGNGHVIIAFFDGDMGQVPFHGIKKPDEV